MNSNPRLLLVLAGICLLAALTAAIVFDARGAVVIMPMLFFGGVFFGRYVEAESSQKDD